MIRYALRCDQGHEFESWFASAAAYDALRERGHVGCAVCGSSSVEKSLMTPTVARPSAEKPVEAARPPAPDPALAKKIEAFRRHIEANFDYVGLNFATEARAMHLGEAPERAIHGEAKIDEARALIDEGVPMAPLPFLPRNRTN